jgi:hypothetical protein
MIDIATLELDPFGHQERENKITLNNYNLNNVYNVYIANVTSP